MEQQFQESVKQKKKLIATSTQMHLPIAEIRDNILVLKNGGLRAILETSSVNFHLKSEPEQVALIYSYQNFLNSLEFPIQIVVRSKKLDIDLYIEKLKIIGNKQLNKLLQQQTFEYIEYIQRLVEYADIMEKAFYVIVPHDPIRATQPNVFQRFWQSIHPADSVAEIKKRHKEFATLKKALMQRVNVVKSGLENCGLKVEQSTTQSIIELFYNIYNPTVSRGQKLTKLEDMRIETDKEKSSEESQSEGEEIAKQ